MKKKTESYINVGDNMKKILIFIILISIAVFCIVFRKNTIEEKQINKSTKEEVKEKMPKNDLGWLHIQDNTLVNEDNEKVRLRGMSTHGIQWYFNFANYNMIKSLKEDLNSNLIRVAMYTSENGYIQDKSLKNKAIEIIDNAIKLDMYVIIDWHILSDNDPMMYKDEAKEFFSEISYKYKDYPNVIYEICNEPNGNITWEENIKPYAEEVISVIRENSKDSIIIVGTPTWSQEVDKAANNPINDKNVMYAFHFYAGTHKEDLRQRVKEALNKIPIFVSEWGVSDASGNGGVYLDEAKKWVDFMDENNLSWANWSLSDKNESSAFFLPGAKEDKIDDTYLSESGKFVKEIINN